MSSDFVNILIIKLTVEGPTKINIPSRNLKSAEQDETLHNGDGRILQIMNKCGLRTLGEYGSCTLHSF